MVWRLHPVSPMSFARPVFKERSLMLTRRVRGQEFLLRPGPTTNNIVGYVLAVMQAKWNLSVIAVVAMSNHWHVVVWDPDGKVVEFQRDCHHFITEGLKANVGGVEPVWSSGAPSRVECEQPEDVIHRVAYCMANPVEAGLVAYGSRWPGLRRAWPSKPKVFKRPLKYFRGEEKGGAWPAQARLELSRPPGFDELSDDELAGLVEGAVEEREQTFRDQRAKSGKPFMGRRAVLRQSRHSRPRSREQGPSLSPTVACRDKWRRIERLQANQQWLDSYMAAFTRHREGDRDTVFPYGTYKMCVVYGAPCAGPPD